MVRRLGADIVATALAAGIAFYDELDGVMAERPQTQAAA